MTDQQSEFDRQLSRPQGQHSAKELDAVRSRSSGVSAEAVASGVEFLFSHRHQGAWSLGSPFTRESASWVTAYVLARLGEIPPHNLSFTQRQQIEESLDWLTDARTLHGGWSFGGSGSPDDADSTAWAVTALRQHSRPVPQEALGLIQRCRRADGGFALYPETAENNTISSASATDVTAICVRALCAIDAISSEFLAAHLRTDVRNSSGRLSSLFFVSSILMDWEPCMAPWFVVNAVRQWVEQQEAEGAWEQALLLRCRMRLQLQSAWPLAACLRRLQRQNGSWPGSARLASFPMGSGSALHPDKYFDEDGVLATVTALSALAIGDQQPGLYFGSDLPFRRL